MVGGDPVSGKLIINLLEKRVSCRLVVENGVEINIELGSVTVL